MTSPAVESGVSGLRGVRPGTPYEARPRVFVHQSGQPYSPLRYPQGSGDGRDVKVWRRPVPGGRPESVTTRSPWYSGLQPETVPPVRPFLSRGR